MSTENPTISPADGRVIAALVSYLSDYGIRIEKLAVSENVLDVVTGPIACDGYLTFICLDQILKVGRLLVNSITGIKAEIVDGKEDHELKEVTWHTYGNYGKLPEVKLTETEYGKYFRILPVKLHLGIRLTDVIRAGHFLPSGVV